MKILILPLLLIIFPSILLFLIIRYWKIEKQFSLRLKVALGMLFVILGLVFTYLAIIVSIHGHMDKGIQSATGVVVFIPMGLLVNLIGIPIILFLEKNIRKM